MTAVWLVAAPFVLIYVAIGLIMVSTSAFHCVAERNPTGMIRPDDILTRHRDLCNGEDNEIGAGSCEAGGNTCNGEGNMIGDDACEGTNLCNGEDQTIP